MVDIKKIKVSDRIRKDFGAIEELAEDISKNGLINPPVVTPEYILIAGERRLKACQELGYKQIEVRVMTVEDAEHQLRLEISENENRKEFTFSERVAWAKRLERIERVKADERKKAALKQNQSTVPSNLTERRGQRETCQKVAQEVGFGSRNTYIKAKVISENATPEIIAKLDEGQISVNKAYQALKQSQEETAIKATKLEKEVNILEEDKNTLKAELDRLNRQKEELEKRLSEIKPETVEVIPEDYQHLKEQLKKVKAELSKKDDELLDYTRSQVQDKNRYQVRETLTFLVQNVGKSVAKAKVEMQTLPEDDYIVQYIDVCIKDVAELLKQLRQTAENQVLEVQ